MRQLYVSGSCTAKPHRPIKSTQHVRLRLSPPWKFTHGWQTTTCKARIKEEKIVISRSSNDKMRKALSALARTVQQPSKQGSKFCVCIGSEATNHKGAPPTTALPKQIASQLARQQATAMQPTMKPPAAVAVAAKDNGSACIPCWDATNENSWY